MVLITMSVLMWDSSSNTEFACRGKAFPDMRKISPPSYILLRVVNVTSVRNALPECAKLSFVRSSKAFA